MESGSKQTCVGGCFARMQASANVCLCLYFICTVISEISTLSRGVYLGVCRCVCVCVCKGFAYVCVSVSVCVCVFV